ncbi:MAG: hypothetical protein IT550_09395 [Novosphingobium sp.]|nr:hypothetical protein [Novosphingobium sp.]
MDFLLFQVLFAVLVIALAVCGWLLFRSLRERREARTQGWTPPPRAPRKRGKAAPEPVADPDPPRVRRRQIVPLAALEASGNGEDPAMGADAPDAEPFTQPTLDPEPAPHVAPESAETPPARVIAPEQAPTPVHGQTMELLEDAFARLQREEITLADYCDRIAAQDRALADRIALLSADPGAGAALDDALAAQDAVRWCREWADELVREASGDPSHR